MVGQGGNDLEMGRKQMLPCIRGVVNLDGSMTLMLWSLLL
jgi:hypothetical protein